MTFDVFMHAVSGWRTSSRSEAEGDAACVQVQVVKAQRVDGELIVSSPASLRTKAASNGWKKSDHESDTPVPGWTELAHIVQMAVDTASEVAAEAASGTPADALLGQYCLLTIEYLTQHLFGGPFTVRRTRDDILVDAGEPARRDLGVPAGTWRPVDSWPDLIAAVHDAGAGAAAFVRIDQAGDIQHATAFIHTHDRGVVLFDPVAPGLPHRLLPVRDLADSDALGPLVNELGAPATTHALLVGPDTVVIEPEQTPGTPHTDPSIINALTDPGVPRVGSSRRQGFHPYSRPSSRQPDTPTPRQDEEDDGNDSLFGSPVPEERLFGSSPSSTLALPGGNAAWAPPQNRDGWVAPPPAAPREPSAPPPANVPGGFREATPQVPWRLREQTPETENAAYRRAIVELPVTPHHGDRNHAWARQRFNTGFAHRYPPILMMHQEQREQLFDSIRRAGTSFPDFHAVLAYLLQRNFIPPYDPHNSSRTIQDRQNSIYEELQRLNDQYLDWLHSQRQVVLPRPATPRNRNARTASSDKALAELKRLIDSAAGLGINQSNLLSGLPAGFRSMEQFTSLWEQLNDDHPGVYEHGPIPGRGKRSYYHLKDQHVGEDSGAGVQRSRTPGAPRTPQGPGERVNWTPQTPAPQEASSFQLPQEWSQWDPQPSVFPASAPRIKAKKWAERQIATRLSEGRFTQDSVKSKDRDRLKQVLDDPANDAGVSGIDLRRSRFQKYRLGELQKDIFPLLPFGEYEMWEWPSGKHPLEFFGREGAYRRWRALPREERLSQHAREQAARKRRARDGNAPQNPHAPSAADLAADGSLAAALVASVPGGIPYGHDALRTADDLRAVMRRHGISEDNVEAIALGLRLQVVVLDQYGGHPQRYNQQHGRVEVHVIRTPDGRWHPVTSAFGELPGGDRDTHLDPVEQRWPFGQPIVLDITPRAGEPVYEDIAGRTAAATPALTGKGKAKATWRYTTARPTGTSSSTIPPGLIITVDQDGFALLPDGTWLPPTWKRHGTGPDFINTELPKVLRADSGWIGTIANHDSLPDTAQPRTHYRLHADDTGVRLVPETSTGEAPAIRLPLTLHEPPRPEAIDQATLDDLIWTESSHSQRGRNGEKACVQVTALTLTPS